MKIKGMLGIVFGMGLVLSMTTLAEAQASRTWVSGVGDDANPCSRTAPCKTFAGAISKTLANGYINALDPGGFGAVTITKSITIDGGGGPLAGILAANTTGVIVNGAGIKVTLRNLSIEGVGTGTFGIRMLQVGALHVEECQIVDFNGPAIALLGGVVAGQTQVLYVSDTTISHTQGIQVTNGRASIDNLRAEGNAFGVRAQTGAIITVRNSTIAGGSTGVGAGTSSSIVNVEDSVITHNVTGVDASGGSTVRLSNTMVWSNSTNGLFNGGGGSVIISQSGNSVEGNPTPGAFTGAAIPKQ